MSNNKKFILKQDHIDFINDFIKQHNKTGKEVSFNIPVGTKLSDGFEWDSDELNCFADSLSTYVQPYVNVVCTYCGPELHLEVSLIDNVYSIHCDGDFLFSEIRDTMYLENK